MPIVNLSVTAEGPIIDVLVGVSEPRRQALLALGQPVPPPVLLHGLIDTGASLTNIVASAIQPLGLFPSGTVRVTTPSTGPTPIVCNSYDVSVYFQHSTGVRVFHTVPVLECLPLSPSFEMLIGRDLLEHCVLVYNGPAATFSLSF